jgi:restriction endonuclease Mrr
VTIPDFQTAMLPVLRAFGSGAKNVGEVLVPLIQEFALTPEEIDEMIPAGASPRCKAVRIGRAHICPRRDY